MKIAILGHPTRGKEVIEILENLGGRNTFNYNGDYIRTAYFIGMDCSIYGFCTDSPKVGFKVYTLEEFKKEFPFKIGDRVISTTTNFIGTITNLKERGWYYVKYDNGNFVCVFRQHLKLYKEMKRNITLTLDKAQEWYKKGGELKEIALQAFTEEELNPLPRSWEEYISKITLPKVSIDRIPISSLPKKYIALYKLEQLRDCWRQGNIPQKDKYKIRKVRNKYTIVYGVEDTFLSFCDQQTSEEFLECFKDLIEKAGDLI